MLFSSSQFPKPLLNRKIPAPDFKAPGVFRSTLLAARLERIWGRASHRFLLSLEVALSQALLAIRVFNQGNAQATLESGRRQKTVPTAQTPKRSFFSPARARRSFRAA